MPTYNPILTRVDLAETRRYAGLAGSKFPNQLLQQACNEAHLLAKPRAIWEIYNYDPIQAVIMSPIPLMIIGNQISKHLKHAVKLAILAVTIGQQLEETVSQHFAGGEYSAGLLLDAAGTTAVEMAADQISALIGQQAASKGLIPLARFSPGYGDWDITVQPKMLELAGAGEIGLTVTATCMLVPRKSITAVIGLVPGKDSSTLPGHCQPQSCSNCIQLNCTYRKEQ